MTLQSAIPKVINSGADDSELNDTIQQYLSDQDIDKTVDQWRVENYAQLRRWAYPPISEMNDVRVKLNSGATELKSEGQNQLNDYVQKCLDVKTRFPKE